MLSVLLLVLSAEPTSLEKFEKAWVANDIPAAMAQVSDNARFTWVMDPSDFLSKKVPDQTFEGRVQVAGFLTSFLPGLRFEPGERTASPGRASYSAKLAYPWLKGLGVEEAQATIEVGFASDGKLANVKISLSPEHSVKAIAALPEQNKNRVRRYMDEVNKKNFAVVDEVLLPSFVQHSMVATSPGREGLKTLYLDLQKAFPDFNFSIDDLIAEGDRVAARITGRYTHKGEFLGVAPTGKAVVLLKMDIFRFVNGRCFEHWDSADRYGLLQQLGATPKGTPRWDSMPGYEGFR